MEILRLMAGGYSNREIASALGTAEGTVKNHASSILSKLGVRDHGFEQRRIVIERGQDDCWRTGALRLQGLQHRDAVHPRHPQIEQDNVRCRLRNDRQRLLAVSGFPHYLHIAREIEQRPNCCRISF